ncbi:MAG TPA: GYD domain-containing protein [Candidatus Limnocylindrales bacterium]|nr:GYD domain-containing protein [Candidatus Limnocylindrales bacterium]
MNHYLFKANYTAEGLKGLIKEGAASRKDAIAKVFESVGGKIDHIYWAFGDADVYVFGDLPSNAAAAACSTTISASGAAAVTTVVLLTADEVDEARGMRVGYRPPGA